MWNLVMPALIGAGIGAGSNLLRGKDPLKGALVGGATGAVTGGMNNYFNTGSLLGASSAGQQVANAAMSANAPFTGAVFNPATGSYLNPEYFVGAGSSMPVFSGGQGLVSNALSDLSNYIPSAITDNLTPQNMLGVAGLLGQQQRPSMPSAPQPAAQTIGGRPVEYTPMSTVKLFQAPRRTLIG